MIQIKQIHTDGRTVYCKPLFICISLSILLILSVACCGCAGSPGNQKQTQSVSHEDYLIKDLTNPSKSTTTEDHSGELYKNSIDFCKDYSTYEINISGISPPIYITLDYTIAETTRTKYYQSSYGSKEYKTEELTTPDPNAYFDITVTDRKGRILANEGYGLQFSHDTNLKDKIRILYDGKPFRIVMQGYNVIANVDISK